MVIPDPPEELRFHLGLKVKLLGSSAISLGWDPVCIRPLAFQQIPTHACVMCESAGPGLGRYVCFLRVCQGLMSLCLGMEALGRVRLSGYLETLTVLCFEAPHSD